MDKKELNGNSSLPPLYPWQEEARKMWLERGRHGIVKVATGSGKTILALSIMSIIEEDCQIKIVVPTIAMAKQWKSDLKNAGFADEIGEWHGDKHSNPEMRFMIYVIDSARYAISTHILNDMKRGKSALLIADECQHYASKENQKIFHFLNARGCDKARYYSLGLSATPECANFDSVLRPTLGDIFFNYDIAEAQANKIISPYFLFQIAVRFSGGESREYIELSDRISKLYSIIRNEHQELRTYDGEDFFKMVCKYAKEGDEDCDLYITLLYKRSAIVSNAHQRINCVLDLLHYLKPASRIILFSERIEQAEEIYHSIQSDGKIRVRIYHSQMSEDLRKKALEDFRDGEARILISCKALDEGLNVPESDVGIVVSCSRSERQRIQRLGRILRAKEGKEPARLYYIYVAGTNDPFVYVGNNESAKEVADVQYGEDGFDYDAYLALGEFFLSSLPVHDGEDRLLKKRCRRIVEEGMLRGDHFLDASYLLEFCHNSGDPNEKLYYWAMACISSIQENGEFPSDLLLEAKNKGIFK